MSAFQDTTCATAVDLKGDYKTIRMEKLKFQNINTKNSPLRIINVNAQKISINRAYFSNCHVDTHSLIELERVQLNLQNINITKCTGFAAIKSKESVAEFNQTKVDSNIFSFFLKINERSNITFNTLKLISNRIHHIELDKKKIDNSYGSMIYSTDSSILMMKVSVTKNTIEGYQIYLHRSKFMAYDLSIIDNNILLDNFNMYESEFQLHTVNILMNRIDQYCFYSINSSVNIMSF